MAELLNNDPSSETRVQFPELVGQDKVKDILGKTLLHDRMAHAYLFLGPEGVGKEAAAIGFARAILCHSDHRRHKTTPATMHCGSCDSCTQSAKLTHPDLSFLFARPSPKPKGGSDELSGDEDYDNKVVQEIEAQIQAKAENPYHVFRVGTAREILVDHIRLLRREFRLRSYTGGARVAIVSGADKMNAQAANAFLKLLEEPPDNTIFILTTSREHDLLPTIVSRCQVVRFHPLTRDTITRNLIDRLQLPEPEALATSRLANHSWRRALDWTQGDPGKETEKVVVLMRDLLRGDPGKIDSLVDHWGAASRINDFLDLLAIMSQWLRDVQRYDADPTGMADLKSDDRLVKFATFTEGRSFEDALRAIDEARLDLERRVQPALVAHTLFYELRTVLFTQPAAPAAQR